MLVDAGATVSVIQAKLLPKVPNTSELVKTMGPPGIPGFEPFSKPLPFKYGNYEGKHTFSQSLFTTRNKVACQSAGVFYSQPVNIPLYYSWDLLESVPVLSETPQVFHCTAKSSDSGQD